MPKLLAPAPEGPYFPRPYWEQRGKWYRVEYRLRFLRAREWAYARFCRKEMRIALRNPDNRSLLEVGCGYGRWFPLYSRLGLRFVGADLSESMLLSASARAKGRVVRGDLTRGLPVKPGWDVLVLSEVLLHIPPEQLRGAWEEVARLRPSIIVVIDLGPYDSNKPTPRLEPHCFFHDIPAALSRIGYVMVGRRRAPGRMHSAFMVFGEKPIARKSNETTSTPF